MILNAIRIDRGKDDRGVSPVIGVILMVAITVILAAVIGTFVLDLGNNAGKSAPSASLAVTANPAGSGNITISHKGGDGLDAAQTRVVVSYASGDKATWDPTSSSNVLSVGDEATINTSAGASSKGQLTWAGGTGRDVSSGSLSSFSPGAKITVQLIDTESRRVIYETTITA